MPSRAVIDDFLAQRRIALVGVSRTSSDFTVAVYKAFKKAGYEVVAVNASASEGDTVDGDVLEPRLGRVEKDVDAVVVMVPPAASADVVREALDRGVTRIWLHRGSGPGSVSDEAVALAREAGAHLVDGACPMMFLGEPGFVHRVHRFLIRRQLTA